MPPFRPPEAQLGATILLASIVVVCFALLGVVMVQIGNVVGVLCAVVLAAGTVGLAMAIYRWRAAKEAVYRELFDQTKDRAWRMLNGKGSLKWGDSRHRLEADVQELRRLQKPDPIGFTWVFIWVDTEE